MRIRLGSGLGEVFRTAKAVPEAKPYGSIHEVGGVACAQGDELALSNSRRWGQPW